MKLSLCTLVALLALAACHTQTNQSATTEAATTADAPATAQAAVANSPGTAYQVYRTLLPGQADSITLHLVSAPRSFSDAQTAGQ
jgi:ABC-type Fe3+-hydroxamate transport system substrate-binding protein